MGCCPTTKPYDRSGLASTVPRPPIPSPCWCTSVGTPQGQSRSCRRAMRRRTLTSVPDMRTQIRSTSPVPGLWCPHDLIAGSSKDVLFASTRKVSVRHSRSRPRGSISPTAVQGWVRSLTSSRHCLSSRGSGATKPSTRALALNVLIGGTDAHAKNCALGLRRDRAQLTPLYDVASAAPYPTHQRLVSAMKVGSTWTMLDVTAIDWVSVSRRLRLPGDVGVAWVDELGRDLPAAFARALSSLPSDVRQRGERLVEPITDHVEGRWKPTLDRNPGLVL